MKPGKNHYLPAFTDPFDEKIEAPSVTNEKMAHRETEWVIGSGDLHGDSRLERFYAT